MTAFVQLPADLADEFHPNVRWVPMPRDAHAALVGWAEWLDGRLNIRPDQIDCPACEHSPHPTTVRLEELQTMPYPEYLRTPEWRRTRLAKLEQVDNNCRRCGFRNTRLHVHHLTYDHLGHEWLDELVALCEKCHWVVHRERKEQRVNWRRKR